MNITDKKSTVRSLVFALGIIFSAAAAAHGGGGFHGGGFHGGGFHGGGFHGGGFHGGGWHGGGWHGAGWGYGGAALIGVGAPLYYGYGGGCQNIQVCNQYGNCWLEQNCY